MHSIRLVSLATLVAPLLAACTGSFDVESDSDTGFGSDFGQNNQNNVNNFNNQNNANNQTSDMGFDFAQFDLDLPDLGPDMEGPQPGDDSDGDGLEDLWEIWAGDATALNWQDSDSNGNGTPDGQEDPDGDGLTNLEEYQVGLRATVPAGNIPHPLRQSILVELDEMQGKTLNEAVLTAAVEAFADAPFANVDGTMGIGLHLYRDQTNISIVEFDGSFEQRQGVLESNPPMYAATPAPMPTSKMVHVIVASRRLDSEFRGGEVVSRNDGDIEKTGLFVYFDALNALHPQCGIDGEIPDITFEEALTGTLVHEMGHILQLGHDDATNGGVNFYNVMSVPSSCGEAQQRFHGDMNADANLGATSTSNAGRFSNESIPLMRFDQMISVHTSELLGGGDGFEM